MSDSIQYNYLCQLKEESTELNPLNNIPWEMPEVDTELDFDDELDDSKDECLLIDLNEKKVEPIKTEEIVITPFIEELMEVADFIDSSSKQEKDPVQPPTFFYEIPVVQPLPAKNTCPDCGMIFDRHKDLTSHQKHHKNFQCNFCRKSFKHLINLKKHICCYCQLCSELFPSSFRFLQHQHFQHKIKTKLFECDFCGKVFMTKLQVHRHIISQHRDTNVTYKCDICPVKSNSKDSLILHMYYHIEVDCEICQGRVKKIQCLWQHLSNFQTHKIYNFKNVELFECLWCGQQFCRKVDLMMHHVKVHEENGSIGFL